MDIMEKIVSLCKRRGFVYPGSEIYGGMANSYDYGPLGSQLKKNIKDLWWETYVRQRDDIVGIDAALIMNPAVWVASGHVAGFADPMVECKSCHNRFRADHLDITQPCPSCGKHTWSEVKQFNLLFKTFVGAVEDSKSQAYLRGETAQAMFVDFKHVTASFPRKLPWGIAQMGKAFRNEITTGHFLFRLREFEQMEIEYFIPEPKTEEDWQQHFEQWRLSMWEWFDLVGIKRDHVHEAEIPDGERAHYSKRTIDFEFDYPFGRKELYGLAYRTNYDVTQHQKHSGQDLQYLDPETQQKYIPHVIEPTWGVDRTFLAVLLDAYQEEEGRIVLKLKPALAPYTVAVFPLLRNKPELVERARKIYAKLKSHRLACVWDDRGNIGKRYFAQDEIGTPWCVTIDYGTLEEGTLTVRDRDTMKQERIKEEDLVSYIMEGLHL